MRLRDDVQRGRERLFNASLSITLHAPDSKALKEMTQRVRAHFASSLGKIDRLTFRQREGLLSTLPIGLNAVASWRTPRHLVSGEALPVLASRPRHAQGHPVRHRHAFRFARRLRPVRQGVPQRQHRRVGPLRIGQVVLDQARGAQGRDARGEGIRHRPGRGVRGHGPRFGRPRSLAGGSGPGHEPLRHTDRGSGRASSSASGASGGWSRS